MPAIPFLLMIVAAVIFGIPAVRAIAARTFDYTNTGLACLAVAFLLGG